MKTIRLSTINFFRPAFFASAAIAVVFSVNSLYAATGNELLVSALPPSAVNQAVINGETLVKAVYDAVLANKEQAPEIVSAAIPKTRSLKTQKEIVKAAISALGDYRSLPKRLIPQIVYAAIKASPNCGSSDGKGGYENDGKSGYSKDADNGCHCAEEFAKSAIESLGADPSEGIVSDIVTSAVQATDGKCADQIANAASQAAPQYANAIADAAANAASGSGAFGDIRFGQNDRPFPVPVLFVSPAASDGLISATTPVN